jgi:2-polyprenyl-3-methyl-5-hydroxy-6-metoxy-1,4-benzoquinol methylase
MTAVTIRLESTFDSMKPVRDDPRHPDPGLAELYGRLPDAVDLEPWLSLARAARQPVLYLGAGAGRLAVPLVRAGIELVLVDAHPAMVAHLRRRLPASEVHQALIEELDLGRTFELVVVPSNILTTAELLHGAARHLAMDGRLAFELTNPHWLEAGGNERFRVISLDPAAARIEVEYPDGTVQEGEFELVWPEQIEDWLVAADLELVRMFGHPDAGLEESPTFYMVVVRLPVLGNGS